MITSESVRKSLFSKWATIRTKTWSVNSTVSFRAQPAVCEFIVELTHESGQKIQELALFLSYMIFKALEIERTGEIDLVKPENIEAAYRDTESWMAQVSEAEGDEFQSTIAASLQRDTEPHLLQYIVSELNEPMDDGAELADAEKRRGVFLLKTIIASLNDQRRIIEIN